MEVFNIKVLSDKTIWLSTDEGVFCVLNEKVYFGYPDCDESNKVTDSQLSSSITNLIENKFHI